MTSCQERLILWNALQHVAHQCFFPIFIGKLFCILWNVFQLNAQRNKENTCRRSRVILIFSILKDNKSITASFPFSVFMLLSAQNIPFFLFVRFMDFPSNFWKYYNWIIGWSFFFQNHGGDIDWGKLILSKNGKTEQSWNYQRWFEVW